MTSTDRHARLAELFDDAIALPATARESFLSIRCGDDAELQQELRELLEHHETDRGGHAALSRPVLDSPVNLGAVMNAVADIADTDPLALNIPGYRVKKSLGEGGMGVVYLAEQDKPRRQVAIKLMRPGFASPSTLKRFDREQELLGRLQHPGIAQIFGAGVCRPYGEGGPAQPYFVMEYVEGLPLDDFCRRHALGTRDRLRLLVQVCEAVQHAHGKGVVHRDLKPGNVLVRQTDALPTASNTRSAEIPAVAGDVKVLDFGVARATGSDIQVTSMHTGVGQLVGTLAYMSPEQAAGDPSRIDVRTDVYALGAIGYQLLAHRLPLTMEGKPLADAARMIRDEDPQPLSLIDRVFRGDLDTIFAKALEKDPSRRYESAAAFAADVQRYLDDQPIVARPASTVYNLRKFARRNKGLVAGVMLAFVMLAGGVIGTTLAMLEARQQRDDAQAAKTAADRDAETARTVTAFLQEMIGAPDPLARINAATSDPKQTRIIDMLDNAAGLVGERFADRPLVEADVRAVLARTFSHLGEFDKAEPMLRRAMDLYVQELGERSDRAIDAMGAVGTLYLMKHRFEEADELLRRQIELCREVYGPTHELTLSPMEQLGLMRSQLMDYDGALEMLSELLEIKRRTLGEEDADTINTMYNVGWVQTQAGRFEQALPVTLEVHRLAKSVFGLNDQRTISYNNNVAYLYERMGREVEAEQMHAENVVAARAVMDENDWHLGVYLHNHASVLRRLKRYVEAEPLELEAIDVFMRNFDESHRRTQTAINGAVSLYEEWGKPEEVEKWRARLTPSAAAQTAPDEEPATQPK